MKSVFKTGYLAAAGYLEPLVGELEGVRAIHGRLVLTDRPVQNPFWAQNIWLDPVVLPIQSISDGVHRLQSIQRNWWLYSFHLHRRAKLIQDQLPHVSAKPVPFPSPLPASPLGSWTLLDKNTILASPRCSSLFPNGEVNFQEDREGPPNRAYLKLWEALLRVQEYPRPGQFCIDAGGSPGGWAWAIHRLGARVLSIDRSPLDPRVASLPGVTFEKRDVFSLKPDEFLDSRQGVDWLFSDVVCFPEKLLHWLTPWVESDICQNLVCTVKFQGTSDYAAAGKFAAIKGSRMIHLYHNKHELTWILLKPDRGINRQESGPS
ncbi:MAG: SAM-dependent methyltransferase [Nitrospinaceae bacterium]